jgi:four helix bundle protein
MAVTDEQHALSWERQQAELWDRIFQVTNDVVVLADGLEGTSGSAVVQREMVQSAMAVGVHLVRANAADTALAFREHLHDARMQAVETDYWLRMAYVLQQGEEVQRDLTSVISQYTAIVDLLQKFLRHARMEKDVVAKHGKGPKVTG